MTIKKKDDRMRNKGQRRKVRITAREEETFEGKRRLK